MSQTTRLGEGLRAVLFDMDGTLLDSEKVWQLALADLATHLGGTLSQACRDTMVGATVPRSVALLFDDLKRNQDSDELAEAERWLTARIGELFELGLPWRPGAAELIDNVREAGLLTALVTNTERFLTDRALTTLGQTRFDVTVCADEVARGKPHPDPYLRAAELLKLNPKQCLAVEDSPTGADAAEAAGCPVLVVPCDIAVAHGPRRHQRATLVGIGAADLTAAWRSITACAHPGAISPTPATY